MFSELVDRAVHTAGRPDALTDIVFFMNETMRLISKRNDFDDDSFEEEIAVPSNTRTVVWKPSVGRSRFRRIEYVEDGCGCRPVMVRPNARMNHEPGPIFYALRGEYVFARVCHPLKIYYWTYTPWLQYYPKGARPATFDVEANDWGTATEAQIDLVSNWMLERHAQTVYEGALAKFFASKQDPRQQQHYAAFEQGVGHIIRGESSRELLTRA